MLAELKDPRSADPLWTELQRTGEDLAHERKLLIDTLIEAGDARVVPVLVESLRSDDDDDPDGRRRRPGRARGAGGHRAARHHARGEARPSRGDHPLRWAGPPEATRRSASSSCRRERRHQRGRVGARAHAIPAGDQGDGEDPEEAAGHRLLHARGRERDVVPQPPPVPVRAPGVRTGGLGDRDRDHEGHRRLDGRAAAARGRRHRVGYVLADDNLEQVLEKIGRPTSIRGPAPCTCRRCGTTAARRPPRRSSRSSRGRRCRRR